jgi:hypothetical protein
MKSLSSMTMVTILCAILFACREREPLNPLDPDNPNTQGKPYTFQASAPGIGRVKLHWSRVDQSQVRSYRIYRSLQGETPSRVADATDTLYFDTQLQAGKAYSYFYRLTWEDGRELHQSPTAGVVTFNAPTGLTITNVTRNRVEMQWNDLGWLDNYARCRIYRQSGGAFSLYDSTSSTQYVDTGVDTGITYHYKLMAVATDGSESNYSGEAYATPGNSAPVIDSLKASQPFAGWGEQVTITCYAHDNDGDPISYSWQALDGGTIDGSGRTVGFTVPQDSGFSHRVVVTVSDNYAMGGRDTLSIETVQIPTAGLVAYYPFNGNANDESGNGNNGTVHGAALTSDRFSGTNRAYSFNGTSDYIEVSSSSQLNIVTNLTISSWIYCNGLNFLGGIISKYQHGGTNGYTLRLGPNSPYSSIDFNNVNTSNGIISLSQWYHVLGIATSTSVKIYVNGILVLSSNPYWQMQTNSDPVRIGLDYSQRYFNGRIDDIRLYNRVLTEQEIQALYHEGGWNGK